MKNLLCIILFIPCSLFAQKQIYIPQEWQLPGGLEYSLDHSAQSENFIVFWGPLAGDDPTLAPAEIFFDPQSILDTAEDLYRFYIDTIHFLNDAAGLLSQYKIILVMLHTWTGIEGWAFGGNYDGIVGAMWMHPHAASSGPTLAHEFTHTLQNYSWMMNPGHGFIDSSYVGFFWETHAEFMALQRYPSVALEFDMARWLNTNQFHWSSTRHHYQAFIFLQFLKERDGIGMINRLWSESIIGEHPLETYMRLKGITQEELNDLFAEYAMRNVTWDYEISDLLRERVSTLPSVFVSHHTIIPELLDSSKQLYAIQNHLAPQDYGYNIIRLYPQTLEDCGIRTVHINFKAQYILPDYEEAGLRYGFVAVDNSGQPRYSELYDQYDEIAFELQDDEPDLYLVVSGAPTNHHNYKWEIGFPKIYRYPYSFRLENAFPEGYQPGFHLPNGVAGFPHVNGGGFVAATAYVESTAYVGPNAKVLDNAQVRDDVRIEDGASVIHSAIVEGSAIISGLAIVGENAHVFGNAVITGQAHVYGGCEVYDSAFIDDNSLIFNTMVYENAKLTDNTFCWGADLHGDILLGGDAEFFRECDNGTYLQFESAYDRNCDGLDDHPANEDVSSHFSTPDMQNDSSLTCEGMLANFYEDIFWEMCEGDTFYFFGEPLTMSGDYEKVFETSSGVDSIIMLWLSVHDPLMAYGSADLCHGDTLFYYGHVITQPGNYDIFIDTFGCGLNILLHIDEILIDTAVVQWDNKLHSLAQEVIFQWYDCDTGLPVIGAVQRTFNPAGNGNYRVRLTTIEGCVAFSECHSVTTVGILDPQLDFSWKVSPNPAGNFIEIMFEQPVSEEMNIQIFDLLGRQHLRQSLSTDVKRLDVRNLPPGSFTIMITTSNGSVSIKHFVKI